MAGNVSDEAFARYVNQIGTASLDQIEAARALQGEIAQKGIVLSLGEVLVQQGILTPALRENIEKKLEVQQQGGLKQLGQYKLLKKLGEGGMGAVYLAEDTGLGRKVALKVLPKKLAGDREFLSRFRREAQATANLNHVNIVSAYAVGEELGFNYYAMEYCDGESLDSLLKQQQRLAWDQAVEIVTQVARGLQHAHERGFIHRDIKPANIFICKPLRGTGFQPVPAQNTGEPPVLQEGFVAKILDLGLSKTIGGDEQTFHTQTGLAVGTPHYVSPEQARGDKSIDGRTDIYSLGATFYHLVTGQTPFQGSTAAVIMTKHLNEQLPNPQDINADIPDGVAHVITRMLAKEPKDRYRDCKELLADLELVIDGKTPASHAIEVGKSSVAMRLPSRDRKGVAPLAHARGPETAAGGTRKHEHEAQLGRLRHGGAVVRARSGTSVGNYSAIIIVAVLGALVFILALSMGGSRDRDEREARAAAEKQKSDEEARWAEEQRRAEEGRLAAEAAAQKKAEATKPETPGPKPEGNTKTETATTEPDTKVVQPDTPSVPSASSAATADKAQQLFKAVLQETAPLLAQNKFADAVALLERKGADPALADAAALLKQEKADVEAVVELRKAAIEALRKQAGQQVTLKKGGTEFKGKVVASAPLAPAGRGVGDEGVTLDVGGAQMPFTATMLSLEDVDQYAPPTGNAGADLRQRGILYLGGGNAAKAKECFTRSAGVSPAPDAGKMPALQPYLDRIAALGVGETEAEALKAWERAEKLFAARDMKGAKAAYEVFQRENGKTQTAAKQAAAIKERYDAIEKVLGSPKEIALDLGGGVKVEMVLIPAGTFIMGSPGNEPGREGDGREGPQHEVTITKPFYMGRYEVTVAQFRRFVESTRYVTEAEKAGNKGWGANNGWRELSNVSWKMPNFPQEDNHPVCFISWYDAQAFVSWAAMASGRTVRLPTEAEWEYACRAKTTTRFYLGDQDKDLDKAGWAGGNSGGKTHPVGQKAPNAWGLYDMHGNAWEWTGDIYQKDYYKDSPRADPPGPTVGKERMLRGGSWCDAPRLCRSACRYWWRNAHYRDMNDGFRLVVVGAPRTP